jgi:hypothetical protein
MEEDYNEPSEGRQALLQRLQELLGDVPPHFWAACHCNDVENLALIVEMAEQNRDIVWLAALDTRLIVVLCK